jgi:hypothetical protein
LVPDLGVALVDFGARGVLIVGARARLVEGVAGELVLPPSPAFFLMLAIRCVRALGVHSVACQRSSENAKGKVGLYIPGPMNSASAWKLTLRSCILMTPARSCVEVSCVYTEMFEQYIPSHQLPRSTP